MVKPEGARLGWGISDARDSQEQCKWLEGSKQGVVLGTGQAERLEPDFKEKGPL